MRGLFFNPLFGKGALMHVSLDNSTDVSSGFAHKHIALIATEDWFVVSHFLPLLRVLLAHGARVSVVARTSTGRERLEALGARVVAAPLTRASFHPLALVREIVWLRKTLQSLNVDAVHLIALRPVLLGGVAAWLAGVPRRIHAITGLGYLAVRHDLKGAVLRAMIRFWVWLLSNARRAHMLFENEDDPASFWLSLSRAHVHLIHGAGVEVYDLPVQASRPQYAPLKVAVVARMIHSKGIDVAVEAVRLARLSGADVQLSLYGLPDEGNPESLTLQTLQAFGTREGVVWHGLAADVRAVWATHDVGVLLTRGGEGLPKTLLEAAMAGKALLTTNTAGCKRFVRHDIEGFVVEVEDVRAAAEALISLTRDAALLTRMGLAARERAVALASLEAIEATYAQLYADVFKA
jgi:glycosyltransferase involved in cell wall biosynthesis